MNHGSSNNPDDTEDGCSDALVAAIRAAKGFIFDMDGTILDSQEAHYRSWDRATRDHGFPHDRGEIFAEFGKTTEAITIALCPGAGTRDVASISRLKESLFFEDIPSLVLFGGITVLFATIKERGKRICIASSNDNRTIDAIIHHVKLHEVIDGFTGLDDITRGKPDPEMIVTSAAKLHLAPGDCVVVGDTPYDIMAGNAAGCFTIGVLTGTFSRDQLVTAGAGAVLPTAAGLLSLVKA
ncbi:MAG: HAD family phosphatase [Candidatus Lokiarchaeota archaeon]|nr:HAD family phosphatase [Candidatus Lokiarchaeota archaeon]